MKNQEIDVNVAIENKSELAFDTRAAKELNRETLRESCDKSEEFKISIRKLEMPVNPRGVLAE